MYSNFSERVRTVKEIKSLGKKVSLDGEIYDFVVDCRGYPEDYSNYIISDKVYLDSGDCDKIIYTRRLGIYLSYCS